jgi:orotidine-5'-phosphate decarboxylase
MKNKSDHRTETQAEKKPIIVALDFDNADDALSLASRLDPQICRVKVGKELHTAAGPKVVEDLMTRGFEVFLDLKFHDIPHTVASACKVAASQGVWMVNVHACGGKKMLEAARNAIDSTTKTPPLLIGVTVLTSLSQSELPEIGLAPNLPAAVLRYAELVHNAGLDGIVCSALEATWLRDRFGKSFKLVTPGIRLPADAKGDQARVVTPVDAIKMGSHYLVIGRSITGSADPIATLHKINDDLKAMEANV